MCLCTTCRLLEGQPCATVAIVPPGSKPLDIWGSRIPESYRATVGELDRFFCPTCGTSLYERRPNGLVLYRHRKREANSNGRWAAPA